MSLRVWARLLLVFMVLMAYGCAVVGPDYTKPEIDLPDKWNSELKNGLQSAPPLPQTLAHWWKNFDDSMLTELMDRVVKSNLNLQSAKARVREARARRGIKAAALKPQLDANGSYSNTRNKENDDIDADPALLESIGLKGIKPDRTTELYAIGFDAGWEIDLFGGVKRSVEAADADLAAAQEEYNGVLVSLFAETALNYIEVRTLQKRLEVAEANINAQQETYGITRSRYKAGLTDEYSVKSAQASLAGTRAQMPTINSSLEAGMNRLAVLVGETPGKLHEMLSSRSHVPIPPGNVAVGVPAETLRNRPDVRQAERLLAAQTARIGVAKAELYPKLSLFGTLGFNSKGMNGMVESENMSSSWGPKVSWGIFRGGAVLQNIEVQSALQEQALESYKSTVLTALEEAENALAAYVGEKARRDELVVANDSARDAFRLARNEYQAGLKDFDSVLVAQQSMLKYEDQLAQSEGTVSTNLVRLYKSLGGGWTTQTVNTALTSE